ncbi:MAG: hypothetical protein HeimC2_13500 [Candidatus Heimdallarchaeota archaeon LC_2]|nr:MAG: hypothetical protein HeimC2_13500 [Candidatus Heimdallarchaeota archaeon LC_2]
MRILIVVIAVWLLSLLVFISPITTGSRITMESGFWSVYSSPSQDKLITVSERHAFIFNLDLEKQGEFNDPEYSLPDETIRDSPPTWSKDEKYVLLQDEHYVYLLNSNNLSIKHKLSKYSDLDVVDKGNHFPLFYIDNQYNLHYLRNNSLVEFDLQTGNIETTLDLSYNNITFTYVEFHRNGDYVALFQRDFETGEVNLVVLNLVSEEYFPVEEYIIGEFSFAPSKPYLGFITTSSSRVEALTIYNIETNTYGESFPVDFSLYEYDFTWSQDSNEILRIVQNDEYGGYERAYTENVMIFNVLTGKTNFNFEYARGLVYESSPTSYAWLSEADKVAIIDWTGIGLPRLVLQNIDKNSNMIYTISGYAIILFGLLSTILLLGLYIIRNPKTYVNLKLALFNKSEFEIAIDEYRSHVKIGFSFLILYYIFASFLNFSTNVVGEYPEQVPITTSNILFYSFLSYVDILIVGVINLYHSNVNDLRNTSSKRINNASFIFMIFMIIARYLQGYSFGIINNQIIGASILTIPFLTISFVYWAVNIDRTIDKQTANSFLLIFIFIIYCLSLFVNVT